MPKRTVYYDENDNELEFYINANNKVYFSVGQKNEEYQTGYITLDKDDLKELIEELSSLAKDLEELVES